MAPDSIYVLIRFSGRSLSFGVTNSFACWVGLFD